MISFSHGDQPLWLIYITIGNLDLKTWQSQICFNTLILSFIIYKRLEDGNNKNQDLETKIYDLALTIIQQNKCHLYAIN